MLATCIALSSLVPTLSNHEILIGKAGYEAKHSVLIIYCEVKGSNDSERREARLTVFTPHVQIVGTDHHVPYGPVHILYSCKWIWGQTLVSFPDLCPS